MSAYSYRVITLVLLILLLLTYPIPASAYTNGMAASVVIGQADFTSSLANRGGSAGANTLYEPASIATDGTRLAIADAINNRVLIYNTIPTTSNASADIVVGQASFTETLPDRGGLVDANTLDYPKGVAFGDNKLIIADSDNDRVLIYNTIPTTNGASADVVIGQTNMTGTSFGTSETELVSPTGVFYDEASQKLVVTDWGNSRVLIYHTIPTANGAAADVVVGQPDFTSWMSETSSTGLFLPAQAKIFQSRLLIADSTNLRILIYQPIPALNGQPSSVVIGQTDMDSSDMGSTASTLYGAEDIAYDGTNLFVSDDGNDRVLMFVGFPTINGQAANAVIGHALLTDGENPFGTPATQYNLYNPSGLAATADSLIVADSSYNRVLIYHKPTSENSVTVSQITTSDTSFSQPDPLKPDGYALRITTGPSVPEAPSLAIVTDSSGVSTTQTMISKNATTHDIHVTIDQKKPLNLVYEGIRFPWEQGLNTAGEMYKFSLVSAFNGYPLPGFDQPVTVILSYDPMRVNATNIQKLKIAAYNTQKNKWEVLKHNTVIDPVQHIVANVTKTFSYFAAVYPR